MSVATLSRPPLARPAAWPALGGLDLGRARLARLVRNRCVLGMFLANVAGAGYVFVLLMWVLPTPRGSVHLFVSHATLFVLWNAVAFPPAALLSARLARPVVLWLRRGGPPDEAELTAVLRLPLRRAALSAALWLVAAVAFGALAASQSPGMGRYVVVTVLMAGLTTCGLVFLVSERVLRPVTALALAEAPPRRPGPPGVAGRLVLAWVMASGVPLLGLVLVGVDVLLERDLSGERIAVTLLVLAGLALLTGLAATVIAARSVADPVASVGDALAEIERGRLDVRVPVDDGSEIGLLQSGFNRMAHGLRERDRLRDLFGRHVGEDVARAALEGEAGLGGQVRDVSVLFVDLVGSTALAARRPPTEVVALLNRFFALVVDAVAAEGGWVNKFEGDAALCVFGAPVDHPDAAGAALRAARRLHDGLARELPGADAAIGVSAGPAVAGNVGAERRFEYTVIGDPVNEAARLCERAKGAPGRALASGVVLARAGGEAGRWALGDAVVLRGRGVPTRVAEPVAASRCA